MSSRRTLTLSTMNSDRQNGDRSEEEAFRSSFLSSFSFHFFSFSFSFYFLSYICFSPSILSATLTYLPLCGLTHGSHHAMCHPLTYLSLYALTHGSHHAMCHPQVPYHASQVSPSIWVRSLTRYALSHSGLSSNNLYMNSSSFQRLKFS